MPLKRASARPAPTEPEDETTEVLEDEDAVPSSQGVRGGWSAGKQTMDETSSYAQAFKPEKDMQIIKFLDDLPYANWRRHWVERQSAQGGTVRRPYACPGTIGKECPLCNVGDKVQGVSSFNIAILGDDGVPTLRTWDVGVKLFNVLSNYAADPKVGPLTKGYFGVMQSGKAGARSGGQVQTNVSPISPTAMKADYTDTPIPAPAEMARLKRYTADDVVQFPKRSELEEVAAEIATEYD